MGEEAAATLTGGTVQQDGWSVAGLAERRIARILGLLAAGTALAGTVIVVGLWSQSRQPWLGPALPILAGGYASWLLGLSSRAAAEVSTARGLETAFLVTLCATGGLHGWLAETGDQSASMASAEFAALSLAAYGSVRLRRVPATAVVLLTVLVHATTLASHPTQAAQGVLLLVTVGWCSRRLAGEIRRAGREADDTRRAALAAEREEASARVHDALSLLRVAARVQADPAGVDTAVFATARRTWDWLQGGPCPASLSSALDAVARSFPDLHVRLDVNGLTAVPGEEVVAATARAVHTLLTNVREHAASEEVVVTARDTSGGWSVIVRDHGVGFDPRCTNGRGGLSRYAGWSLRALGIEVAVRARPGDGTCVVLAGRIDDRRRGGPDGGRFARWAVPPSQGLARARHLADLGRGLTLVPLWLMIAAGAGHLLRHSAHPALALALVLVSAGLLTAAWILDPEPSVARILAVGTTGILAGTVVSFLAGPSATTGDKLGLIVSTWSALHVAVARERLRILAASASAVVLLVGLVAVDPLGGLVAGLYGALCAVIPGMVVTQLRTFGLQADDARTRMLAAERRRAATLLERQLMAARSAARVRDPVHRGPSVQSVIDDCEAFLARTGPGAAGGSGLAAAVAGAMTASAVPASTGDVRLLLDDLDVRLEDDGAAVGAAVAQVVAGLQAAGLEDISVRGAGTSAQWSIAVTGVAAGLSVGPEAAVGLHPAEQGLPAETTRWALRAAGVQLEVRRFRSGGLLRVELVGGEERSRRHYPAGTRHGSPSRRRANVLR